MDSSRHPRRFSQQETEDFGPWSMRSVLHYLRIRSFVSGVGPSVAMRTTPTDAGTAGAAVAVEDEGLNWSHHLVRCCQRLPPPPPLLMWIHCRAEVRRSRERAGRDSAASLRFQCVGDGSGQAVGCQSHLVHSDGRLVKREATDCSVLVRRRWCSFLTGSRTS